MNSTKTRIILVLAILAAVHSNPIIVINNNVVNIGANENGDLQHSINENMMSLLRALFEQQTLVIHNSEEQVEEDDTEEYQEVERVLKNDESSEAVEDIKLLT